MLLKNFLLKSKCIVCSRISSSGICKNCSNQFQNIPEPFCQICKSIEINNNQCQECLKRPPLFKTLTIIGIYNGLLKTIIFNYKYECIKDYAKPLAKILSEQLKAEKINPDYITSIPLHEEKIKKRGFNQAELIAVEIAKNLRKPYLEIFSRVKNTKPQFSLSSEEREANLKDAFQVNDNKKLNNKTILIIDDIFTTGTTLQEASRLLINSKVKEINLAVLARSIK